MCSGKRNKQRNNQKVELFLPNHLLAEMLQKSHVHKKSIKLNIINIIIITYNVGSNGGKEDYGGKRMLDTRRYICIVS